MSKATGAAFLVLLAVAAAAPQNPRRLFAEDPSTTPKPIVQIKRLINQQNGDGSYTYGFEADDGSFKIETRDELGNVKGKYGYVDVNNELKVVDYTAGNGTGFDAQADFLPKPQQPLPVPEQAEAPSRPRNPARSFQQPQPQQPRPQQQEARPAAPQRQAAPHGISHFEDPQGIFQFSFPSPGEPARAAPSGSFPAEGSFNADGQYIPSIALEGFSEDADKDGFVDAVPQDGSVPVRSDRPRGGNQRPSFTQQATFPDFEIPRQQAPQQPRPQQFAPPQFAPPQERPRQFAPQQQQRPQQFSQLPPNFIPPQPEQAQGPIPGRFAFGGEPFPQQQEIPTSAFLGQQPQFFGPPQQQDPRFSGFQPAPARFLQPGQQEQQIPVFQGSTERSRVNFVNPLALQQGGGRRPF